MSAGNLVIITKLAKKNEISKINLFVIADFFMLSHVFVDNTCKTHES